ncbi:hypothetical protein [Risungbinella massiliensis]|uniref:hypothetical protein n=1 Tax=Risungbinella massiliensis TaxID=1329796 RepID=UPI0005CC03C3|nr:hypothetical protein [Risungbinella massiliensis]
MERTFRVSRYHINMFSTKLLELIEQKVNEWLKNPPEDLMAAYDEAVTLEENLKGLYDLWDEYFFEDWREENINSKFHKTNLLNRLYRTSTTLDHLIDQWTPFYIESTDGLEYPD